MHPTGSEAEVEGITMEGINIRSLTFPRAVCLHRVIWLGKEDAEVVSYVKAAACEQPGQILPFNSRSIPLGMVDCLLSVWTHVNRLRGVAEAYGSEPIHDVSCTR